MTQPDQMRAVLLEAPRSVRLTEVPVPALRPTDLLVKVDVCTLGGGCLRAYRGDYHGEFSRTRYPIIPGSEIAGVVARRGSAVDTVEVGQRVIVEPIIACGSCHACQLGRENCCERIQLLGHQRQGGFAEYVSVPATCIHPVPDRLSSRLAALAQPFAIAMRAAERVRITAADEVVVLGAGFIGTTILLVARSRGARVLVVEPNEERRRFAAELGASAVCAETGDAAREAVLAFTEGRGASVVIDATGLTAVIATMTKLAAVAGRIGIVGAASEPVPFSTLDAMYKELEVLGVRNGHGLYGEAIRFLTVHGALASKLIGAAFPFAESLAAFKHADHQTGDPARVFVELTDG